MDISEIKFQSPSTVENHHCDTHTAVKIAVPKAISVGDVRNQLKVTHINLRS
jgi:hypothetical protein